MVKSRFSCLQQIVWLALSLVLLTACPAQAVQVHGPPEGLYVHQMAHVLFAIAMIFLIYTLHMHPVGHCQGWKYLKISLFFFLLWNINALVVHSLGIKLPEGAITGKNLMDQALSGPLTWQRWLFYITRNDHLLCVPAMWFMMLFLKNSYHEAVNEKKEREVCKKK